MVNVSSKGQEVSRETSPAPTKRRRWPFGATCIVVLALAIGFGAWTAYWLLIVDHIETVIDDWIADQQREGMRFSYRKLEFSGFPFWLHIRMEGAKMLIEQENSWEWHPSALVAGIRPWNPTKIALDLSGVHQFVGARHVDLTLRNLGAVINFQERGAWRGTLTGEGVSAGFSLAKTFSAKSVKLDVHWRGNLVEAGQSPLRLDFSGDNIKLPANWSFPLGREVAILQLTTYVVEPFKVLLDPEFLRRWRDGGGTLELERLRLEYGPLRLDGDGTFALDYNLQPMGALVVRAEGFIETLDLLRSRNKIGIAEATAAKMMLLVLAHQSRDGPSRIRVPLTLQDREVTLKSLPIMRVPRIDWARASAQLSP